MRDEVIAALNPQPGQTLLDCTLGGGGHAFALAPRLTPGGRLIGLDQDPDALAEAGPRLASFGDTVILKQARFDALGKVLDALGIGQIDGALFDLGVSSYQLDTPSRGFSFKDPDALLDMRMNPASGGPTAADLLNRLSERELATLNSGEFRRALGGPHRPLCGGAAGDDSLSDRGPVGGHGPCGDSSPCAARR